MNIIKEISAFLEVPYFFIMCVSIFAIFAYMRNKVGFFFVTIITFAFVWRLFFRINSSRYTASFLPLLLIIAILLLKRFYGSFPSFKSYFLLFGIALLSYNTIKVYGGFRNRYISDIAEDVNLIYRNDPKSAVFIQEKEFNRLKVKHSQNCFEQFSIDNLDESKAIRLFFNSYSKYGEDIYIVYSGTEIDRFYPNDHSAKNMVSKIRNYYTNNSRTKTLSVYKYDTERLDYVIPSYDPRTNLIKNGDCEILQTNEEKRRMFKSWIDAGCTFFELESISMPKFSIILPEYRSLQRAPHFPKIYAEKDNPINGNYSLHLDFRGGKNYIYLLNHLPPKEGVLSFSIKSLSKDTFIKILIQGYIKGVAHIPPDSVYYFSIKDSETHTFQIKVNSNMLCGNKIIFCLFSEKTDFIIDDISYLPAS